VPSEVLHAPLTGLAPETRGADPRELAKSWDEVVDLFAVRARALSLLARHDLRAADAAQLGAALLAAEDHPASLTFVCLDDRLAAAAEREGLRVLTHPSPA
jgi:hypothetical protein